MKKYFLFLIITISFLLSLKAFAETTINSGFIPGQIWYSKESLIEGETVNIYTAIWNGEKDTVSAKVEFYDKNVILGTREISISSGELKDVYIPWKITAGDHIISAKTISSTVMVSGKKEKVVLNRTTTANDKQFVPVLIKNAAGENVREADVLKNQIDKASNDIGSIIPDNVRTPITSGLGVVDNLRTNTLAQINTIVDATKKDIGQVLGTSTEPKISDKINKVSSTQDAIKKPIAYIKGLFLMYFYLPLYFYYHGG
ncbi:MAG: hypothetical protein NTV03_04035 [Candidatus Nomurabacteria bacterium]|nr:hypothetical protein [Candidatus Nomurabacteria bacterium]